MEGPKSSVTKFHWTHSWLDPNNCFKTTIISRGFIPLLSRPLPCLAGRVHPSQHSSAISVLSAADDRNHNFEDDIEHRKEKDKKTTDYDDFRRDYGARHCRIDCHCQLKCLRCRTNSKMRSYIRRDTHKPIGSSKWDGWGPTLLLGDELASGSLIYGYRLSGDLQ